MSGEKLGELQTRAARLAAAPGIDRGTLAVKVRELITAAYELGRQEFTAAYELGRVEHGRELADVLRALIDSGELRSPAVLAALGPLIPPPLALSDDDSEPEADAAEQRAQFAVPALPFGPTASCRDCASSGVGVCDAYPDCPAGRRPAYIAPVETGEPFRGAAEREWDDSRGGEP